MIILTKRFVFTTHWSTQRDHPGLVYDIYPPPKKFVGISFWGWAIVGRTWHDKWTNYSQTAAGICKDPS